MYVKRNGESLKFLRSKETENKIMQKEIDHVIQNFFAFLSKKRISWCMDKNNETKDAQKKKTIFQSWQQHSTYVFLWDLILKNTFFMNILTLKKRSPVNKMVLIKIKRPSPENLNNKAKKIFSKTDTSLRLSEISIFLMQIIPKKISAFFCPLSATSINHF